MKIARASFALGLAGWLGAAMAFAAAPQSKGSKGPSESRMGKSWETFATRFDANKDGKVSKEEFLGKHPGFERLDANKDGAVTAEEAKTASKAVPAAAQGKKAKKGFVERFDADKDGKVTLDEFNRGRGAGFDKMDTGKDGAVDRKEFESRVKDAAAARDVVEED